MSNNKIPFDGFASVVEMLKRSDGNFRDKILGNLRKKDPNLARRLEAHLGIRREPQEDYSQSQRSALSRTYGA